MKEFFLAALPWLAIGFAVAIFAAGTAKKKGKSEKRKTQGSLAAESLALWICAGVAFGATGIVDMSVGICVGLLFGVLMGVRPRR